MLTLRTGKRIQTIFFILILSMKHCYLPLPLFLQSFLEMKMTDFDAQVQSMNRWMNDSEKLVNSLHVGMDPNEVSKRVQQIKVGELCLRPLPLSKAR